MTYACKDCGYFEISDSTCRFNAPPTIDQSTAPSKQNAVWPTVIPDTDWCGEFIQKLPSAG